MRFWRSHARAYTVGVIGHVKPALAALPAIAHELIKLLSDDHDDVRLAAVEALGELGPSAAFAAPELVNFLLSAQRSGVHTLVGMSLFRLGLSAFRIGPSLAPPVATLIQHLKGDDSIMRVAAALFFEDLGPSAIGRARAPKLRVRGRMGPEVVQRFCAWSVRGTYPARDHSTFRDDTPLESLKAAEALIMLVRLRHRPRCPRSSNSSAMRHRLCVW